MMGKFIRAPVACRIFSANAICLDTGSTPTPISLTLLFTNSLCLTFRSNFGNYEPAWKSFPFGPNRNALQSNVTQETVGVLGQACCLTAAAKKRSEACVGLAVPRLMC